jgi:hypothetical protein
VIFSGVYAGKVLKGAKPGRVAGIAAHQRCDAEQRDELAPFQLTELHRFPASLGRTAKYRFIAAII